MATGFASVKETGALPGERVKCVDPGECAGVWTAGEICDVVDFCGTPCVHGNGWKIPLRGHGARWEKAA